MDALKQAKATTDSEWVEAWVARATPDSDWMSRSTWISILELWIIREADRLSAQDVA